MRFQKVNVDFDRLGWIDFNSYRSSQGTFEVVPIKAPRNLGGLQRLICEKLSLESPPFLVPPILGCSWVELTYELSLDENANDEERNIFFSLLDKKEAFISSLKESEISETYSGAIRFEDWEGLLELLTPLIFHQVFFYPPLFVAPSCDKFLYIHHSYELGVYTKASQF